MKAPPKGAGSVEDRVRSVINKLTKEELIVSVNCPHVREMFAMLKRGQDKFGNDELFKPQRSKYIHMFDAISYPIYFYDLLLEKNKPASGKDMKNKVLIVG